MDCKTIWAHKFRTVLGFIQFDVILRKRIINANNNKSSFEGENIQPQFNVLSYRIDLYIHEYKLAKKFDENKHSDRNIDYEIKRQKAIN